MTEPLRPILSLFPLIDDPANIFYSKLKQLFSTQFSFKAHAVAKTRLKREITCSFLGISRTYRVSYNISDLKDEDYNKGLYLQFTFGFYNKIVNEKTITGEDIPVDWGTYIASLKDPDIAILPSNKPCLYRNIDNEDSIYIYIYVGRIIKRSFKDQDFYGYDIEGSDLTNLKIDYKTAYKQSIGRRIIFKSGSSPLGQECRLDRVCIWELYDIDSDNNYTLIDQSGISPEDWGYSLRFPTQYGPAIDHPVKLIYYYKQDLQSDPKTLTVEVRDRDFPSKECNGYECNTITMYKETEPFTATRGFVPYLYSALFKGLKFRTRSSGLCKELVFLAIQYITNVNLRYILTDEDYNKFTLDGDTYYVRNTVYADSYGNVEVSIEEMISGSTYYYNENEDVGGAPNYLSFTYDGDPDSIPTYQKLNTIEHRLDVNNKYSIVNLMTLLVYYGGAFGTSSNYVQDLYEASQEKYCSLYDIQSSNISYDIDNANVDLPLAQNSIPSSTLPNLRWYQREYIYLMEIWRFCSSLYHRGRMNMGAPTRTSNYERLLNSLPSELEEVINENLDSYNYYQSILRNNLFMKKNEDKVILN